MHDVIIQMISCDITSRGGVAKKQGIQSGQDVQQTMEASTLDHNFMHTHNTLSCTFTVAWKFCVLHRLLLNIVSGNEGYSIPTYCIQYKFLNPARLMMLYRTGTLGSC